MAMAPHHQRPSGWNALLPKRSVTVALRGDVCCDYAVVGAGFTGLAAARTWAMRRPQDDVRVLDADVVGEGSSGRNSGFLLDIALADDANAAALARMEAMNTLTRGAMNDLAAQVAAQPIECALTQAGVYRAAATERGGRAVMAYETFLKAQGLDYELLDRDALQERLGTQHYQVGLYSPDCYLVQPAALVRGLAAALPPNVRLHERSAVLRLERAGGEWVLHTAHGRVRSKHVQLANNGWAATLGEGADRVTPVFTYAALTAPLPAGALGRDPQWGVLPAAKLGTTVRTTADNRLLVRSLYSYRKEQPMAEVSRSLRASMCTRWPSLKDTAFEQVWGGSTGITYNGAWWFRVRPDGLAVAAGCNGGGVVKGTLFGALAARAALGDSIPDVAALFGSASWVPPEPLRGLGFALLTRWWRRQAGNEI